MQRKTTRHKAFAPDPDAPERCCDYPGCDRLAGYRAPRSRDALDAWYWFCLDHVREYNARWDYYRGMTPGQIEAHLRADTSWQRPSWKLGRVGGSSKAALQDDLFHDPLDILKANGQAALRKKGRRPPQTEEQPVPEALRQPLAMLNLPWPTTFDDVKNRYRILARRHHPDANVGDRAAEERFKAIGAAYSTLRAHFTSPETTASS